MIERSAAVSSRRWTDGSAPVVAAWPAERANASIRAAGYAEATEPPQRGLLVSRTLSWEPGQVSYCGNPSVISYQGDFEPTQKWPSGRLLGACSSPPRGTPILFGSLS